MQSQRLFDWLFSLWKKKGGGGIIVIRQCTKTNKQNCQSHRPKNCYQNQNTPEWKSVSKKDMVLYEKKKNQVYWLLDWNFTIPLLEGLDYETLLHGNYYRNKSVLVIKMSKLFFFKYTLSVHFLSEHVWNCLLLDSPKDYFD